MKRTILSRIGNKALALYKGEGYWYFTYDKGAVYETYSVMTMRLNDMSVDRWVEIGAAFAADVEAGRFDAFTSHY